MRFVLMLILALSVLGFAACSSQTAPKPATPTAVFQSYIEASNKKDTAAMKQYLSKGSLDLLEKSAQAQNISVDDALKNQTNLAGKIEAPETRNEKIEGANATLEYKNAQTGTWDKVYFAQENGSWKIALDKLMEEMLKDVDQPKP